MSPIQQMLLGVGAVATKTYVDDVFSTYLYTGTAANRSINNGIDLSGEGGMVWFKARDNSYSHGLFDTERGASLFVYSNSNAAQVQNTTTLTAFNNNGFSLGADTAYGIVNTSTSDDYSSWTFRKAPGFFDVVTYTGNDTNRTIAHSLGCVPGMILIKGLDAAHHWQVYHRGVGNTKVLKLNDTDAASTSGTAWNNTSPTATHFSLGTEGGLNTNNQEFVAYLFAGGESAAATARSVVFDGDSNNHDDELHPPSSLIPSGRDSNKFCLETWLKVDATNDDGMIYGQYVSGNAGRMFLQLQNSSSPYNVRLFVAGSDAINVSSAIQADTWYHLAWTYDGTTHRMFINGELKGTIAGSSLAGDIVQSTPRIGGINETGFNFPGQLSNFRVVHDQAVYTAAFKPSVTPLTTTSQGVSGSNCKVLCCNNSNILNNDGALAALTNPDNGTITASTDSPFDDLTGFVFGENEDQDVIKCGSYVGNGSSTGPEINLGWEPQFLIIKGNTDWHMVDSMRGIVTGGNEPRLFPNDTGSEAPQDIVDLTPTGFKVTAASAWVNADGVKLVYLAIRRPDGYVGKPPELGTGVFTTAVRASSTAPRFISNFPVDFALYKNPASSMDWFVTSRLTGPMVLRTNTTEAEVENSDYANFDHNNGFQNQAASGHQSWMFKRHAGFDIMTYAGGGTGTTELHSLNAVPEMIWVKCRSSTHDWAVYHKGLNGGTNPEQKYLVLNSSAAEVDNSNRWNDTAPTATTFTVGGNDSVGNSGDNYIAMLFASVDGISKVGSYSGSDSTLQITTGFQPRLVIIKRYTADQGWVLVDSVNGDGKFFSLHGNDAVQTEDLLDFNSTGFELTAGSAGGSVAKVNGSGESFIYYAHA